MHPFDMPISARIWEMKYRLTAAEGSPLDATVSDSWRRTARALAAVEQDPAKWQPEFEAALQDFRFLPAGRILAGAGSGREVTLFNCFVMGTVPDSISGIFEHLREAALTLQQGGGIGYDFSTIRPRGALVHGVAADASGPLSFMDVWDAMCRTIMSAGSRRGAMMATLRCDHPDIEAFIAAKRDPLRLRNFNLSVLVSDAFMAAVKADQPWLLQFGGKTYAELPARALWEKILRATYDYAEPGVIFIDRINAANNLRYAETIAATNPCGEQPLPPYGACLLGSINLARLVRDPFTPEARIEAEELGQLTRIAVRMMDNVVDASRFPLPQQEAEARAKRRIGLGVTGLADALVLMGLRYGSEAAVAQSRDWLAGISHAAYQASIDLAAEKGPFPLFEAEGFLASGTMQAMPEAIRAGVRAHGIRNALLTSIAPTGTISLLAGNVSSGIEPIFALSYTRKVLMPDGSRHEEEVLDHAVALWRKLKGDAPLPDYFVTAQDLTPRDHLAMQAAAQEHVDSSISKTINVPEDISFAAFGDVYLQAYEMGCKGCTTYRPNDVTGSVLSTSPAGGEAATPVAAKVATGAAAPSGADGLPTASTAKAQAAATAGGAVVHAASAAEQGAAVETGVAAPDAGALEHGAARRGVADQGAETRRAASDLSRPLDRPPALEGATYKLKWPDSEHALYITLNDVEIDGRRRPFEVFINSKNMEHFAWTVALTRMISAVFRRGGDTSFVVEELKAVFDPRGGAWIEGRYVPSMLAAIGGVIEKHMIAIGFLGAEGAGLRQDPQALAPVTGARPKGKACPSCGQFGLVMAEGCLTCLDCGYSKCG